MYLYIYYVFRKLQRRDSKVVSKLFINRDCTSRRSQDIFQRDRKEDCESAGWP